MSEPYIKKGDVEEFLYIALDAVADGIQ